MCVNVYHMCFLFVSVTLFQFEFPYPGQVNRRDSYLGWRSSKRRVFYCGLPGEELCWRGLENRIKSAEPFAQAPTHRRADEELVKCT